MTREETIERLKRRIDCIENGALCSDFGSDKEVFDMAIKALEQEPILDKIRAEIEQIAKDYDKFADYRRVRGLWIALDIIDKYKAEK